jgi:hypothetical protein
LHQLGGAKNEELQDEPVQCENTAMKTLPCTFLILFACSWACHAPAEDTVLHTNIDRTDVSLFLPDGLKVVCGVLINPADTSVGAGTAWGESCRHWGMAQLGLMLENVDKRNNRPNTLKKVIAASLREFAARTSHPEIIDAPLAFGGMSKGGGWSAELGQFYAERTIAFNNVCGWVGRPDQDLSMPAVIVIGGIADGFKMLGAIGSQYEPARNRGAPWCLALQWGNAHNYGNANALALPFLDAVIAARVPRTVDRAAGPVKLKPMRLEDGWLGDRGTWESNQATVAPYAGYQGDKRTAAWLPNRYVAFVWRSFVSKDPPVQIVAATLDGKLAIEDFRPTDKRFLIVGRDEAVRLQARARGTGKIRSVALFDGDNKLGEATGPEFSLTWSHIPAGPRAVFAEYVTADGAHGLSNPVAVIASPHQ